MEDDVIHPIRPNEHALERDICIEQLKEENIIQFLLKNDPEFKVKIEEIAKKLSENNSYSKAKKMIDRKNLIIGDEP